MARRRSSFAGVPKLRKTLKRISTGIDAPVKVEMKKAAEKIGDDARARTPIGATGDLQKSLVVKMSQDGISARIGYHPNAPGFKLAWRKAGWRAGFVEFGTVKKPGGVFMVNNAWEMNRRGLIKNVNKAVDQAVRRAAR